MIDLMSVLHPATPPEPKGARIIRGCMGPPHDDDDPVANRQKKMDYSEVSFQRKKKPKPQRKAT